MRATCRGTGPPASRLARRRAYQAYAKSRRPIPDTVASSPGRPASAAQTAGDSRRPIGRQLPRCPIGIKGSAGAWPAAGHQGRTWAGIITLEAATAQTRSKRPARARERKSCHSGWPTVSMTPSGSTELRTAISSPNWATSTQVPPLHLLLRRHSKPPRLESNTPSRVVLPKLPGRTVPAHGRHAKFVPVNSPPVAVRPFWDCCGRWDWSAAGKAPVTRCDHPAAPQPALT